MSGLTPAFAYDIKLAPLFSAEETYSDNKNLEPEGSANAGFITTTTAGFDMTGKGNRSGFGLRYALQSVLDNDQPDTHQLYHLLDANGNAELVRNHVFLNASASARQRPKSLLDPVSVDSSTAAGNLQQTYSWSATPALVNRLGNFADSRLEYTHDEVYYRASSGEDSTADTGHYRLSSGELFGRTQWALDASYRKVHAGELDSGRFGRYAAELGYQLDRHWLAKATGGYEKNDYQTLRSKTDGSFWEVGLDWAPTQRSRMSVGYGERFFGKTWRASLEHERRYLTFDASYSETLTSDRENVLRPTGTIQIFDPNCPRSDPTCLPTDTVTVYETQPANSFFIAKSGRASVAADLGRHRVTVGVGTLEREYELTGEHTYEEGVDVAWDYTAEDRWRYGLAGSWSQVSFHPENRDDDYWSIQGQIGREVFRDARVALTLRHQTRKSTDPGAEYRENAATLGFYLHY